MSDGPSLRTIANERTSIFTACRLAGVDVPDFEFGSPKLYCPWGEIYHIDEGRSKSFRVYPQTNSCYCFACGESFRPVKLVAKAKGISEDAAAEYLLDLSGYVPPDPISRWEAVTAEADKIDTSSLAEALKIACAAVEPDWEMRQLDEAISGRLRQCLGLLVRVKTPDDAKLWLSATKKIMYEALGAS